MTSDLRKSIESWKKLQWLSIFFMEYRCKVFILATVFCIMRPLGSLGEWFKPAVLKTAEQKCSVSSNLTASASQFIQIVVISLSLFAVSFGFIPVLLVVKMSYHVYLYSGCFN